MNLNEQIRHKNIATILKHPEEIVKSVASQKVIFTKADLEKEILRYVGDDAVLCGLLRLRLDWVNMPSVIGRTANDNPIYEGKGYKEHLKFEEQRKETVSDFIDMVLGQKEIVQLGQNIRGESIYTSEEYKDFEASIEASLQNLKERTVKPVNNLYQNWAISNVESEKDITFSPEQKAAVDYLLSDKSIAVLTGRAGTGKTTVLKPVVQAYQRAGYTVFGAAFQGKVADMLARDLGVERFTLDQLKKRWQRHESLTQLIKAGEFRGKALQQAQWRAQKLEQFRLTAKHVLIIDEANMVGGVLWQALLKEVEQSGAILRVVEDNYQIKALFGGDIARLVEEKVGSVTLQKVVRQKIEWMQEASALLNNHRAEEGLKPYLEHGNLQFKESIHAAKYATVADYVNFYEEARETKKSQIALAFRNEDVNDLNHAIHHQLKLKDLIKDEFAFTQKIKEKDDYKDNDTLDLDIMGDDKNAQLYSPAEDKYSKNQDIQLAIGEKIRFRSNDHTERFVKTIEAGNSKTKGVQNGTVGYIDDYDAKRGTMHVRLEDGRLVGFDTAAYKAIDYAYAITVMQSEGETYHRTYLYCDPLMNLNNWLIAFTRHVDSISAFVSKKHAANLKELIKVIKRSDYRPLIKDHTLTDEQKPYFELVKNYREQIDHAFTLVAQIRELEAKDENMTNHPLWDEYKQTCLQKKELAVNIVNAWDETKIFAQQAGLRREHMEIEAGIREKLFSEVEAEAIERVDTYQHIALETRALWEKIKETHVGERAKDHPLYDEFALKRQQRNALAYEITTFAMLHSPFMKTTEKVQDGITKYINFSGHEFNQKPPGLKATQTFAEQYIFSYKLSASQKEYYQDLIDFKELKGQIADLYHQIKDAESIQVTPKVSEHLQGKMNKVAQECDSLAYRIVSGYENYEALIQPEKVDKDSRLKYAIKIKEEDLLRHATFGELREAITNYQQAQTLQECFEQGNRVYKLICGEGEQVQFNKQLYGLAASQGVSLSRLKLERGYEQYFKENKTELYQGVKGLKAAYEEIHAYRETHKKAADAWNIMKTKATEKIETLQEAQINSLNKLSLTNLLNRQELLDQEIAARGLKEANSDVFIAIDRRIRAVVNSLHDNINIIVASVNWTELKQEIETQQEVLNTLYPHLQKGQTSSYIGIYQESGLELDWGKLRHEKLQQAPQLLQAHGTVLQFASPSEYKRLLKEAHEQDRLEATKAYATASPSDKPRLAKEIMDWITLEQREKLTYTRAAVQQSGISLDGLKIFSKLNSLSPEESHVVASTADRYINALTEFSNLWKEYREAAEKALLGDYIALYEQQAAIGDNLHQKNPKVNPHYYIQNCLRTTDGELKAADITSKIYAEFKQTEHNQLDDQHHDPAQYQSLKNIENRLGAALEKANEDFHWQLNFSEIEELSKKLIDLSLKQNGYFEKIWSSIQKMTEKDNPLIPAALERNERAFFLIQDKSFKRLVESGEKEHVLSQVHDYACRYALSKSALKDAYKNPETFLDHPVGQFLQAEISKCHAGITRNVQSLSEERIISALKKAEIPIEILGFAKEQALSQENAIEKTINSKADRTEKRDPDSREMRESLWPRQAEEQRQSRSQIPTSRSLQKETHTKESVQQALTPSSIRSIYEMYLPLWNVDSSKCRSGSGYLHFGREGKFDVNIDHGSFNHFKTGEKGDIFEFVMKSKGLRFPDAIRWIGNHINAPKSLDPEQLKRQQETRQKQSEAEEFQKLKKSKELSFSEFQRSKSIEGTLGERYLREHRNYLGEIPTDIRFMSQASPNEPYPAVISFARDKDGIRTGFQKILLNLHTGNKIPKREGLVVKRSGGTIKNAAVRIQEGKGVTYLAEGIETALSIKDAGVEGEILSGFGQMVFQSAPIRNKVVVICADYDGIDAKTHKARLKDKEFLEKKGYQVHIVWPATHGEKKIDFNDILKIEGAEKVKSILQEQLLGSILGKQENRIGVELKNNENVSKKEHREQTTFSSSSELIPCRASTQESLSQELAQEHNQLPHQKKEAPSLIDRVRQELSQLYPDEAQKSLNDFAQDIKTKALCQPLTEELLKDLCLNKQDVISKASKLIQGLDQKDERAISDFEILAQHVMQNDKLFINIWMENHRIADKLSEHGKTKDQIEPLIKEELTAGVVISRIRFSLSKSEQLTNKELIQEAQKELSTLANQVIKNEKLMFNVRLHNKDIFNKIHAIVTEEKHQQQNQHQLQTSDRARQRNRTIELDF